MSDIQAQLKEHLDKSEDWEKMETPIDGVFVVKIPATKTRPALLQIEINPISDDGKPMKRKGLFVGNLEMFIKFHDNLVYLGLMITTVCLLLYTVVILYNDPSVVSGKKARSYSRTALWIGSTAFFVGAFTLSFM